MASTLDRKVIELILGDTLPYELNQLEQCYILLQQPQQDQCIVNALIESFCIHARQLLDFFRNRGEMRAHQFLGGTYDALHVVGISRGLQVKLNEQIAHITVGRTTVQSEKIGPEDRTVLLVALVPEADNFISRLAPAERKLVLAKYQPKRVVAAR